MKRSARNFRIILIGYIIFSAAFLFYSYTQVDPGLSITRFQLPARIIRGFQELGFRRPLSLTLFTGIVSGFTVLYFLTLRAYKSITKSGFYLILASVTGILVLGYPAYSHDIFNYLFSARILVVYGKNPFTTVPLAFASFDPWLSFMRWTHLPSAYTPLWIAFTVPLYLIGLGRFVTVLFTFKAFLAACFVATVVVIGEIMKNIDPDRRLRAMIFFGLNPLVLMESVISPHNDIVMALLAVGSYLIYLKRRRLLSFLALAVSAAAKTMTVFLYPVALTGWNPMRALIAMTLATLAGFAVKELLPWYLLWVLPFAALNVRFTRLTLFFALVSIGFAFSYAPHMYFGDYRPEELTAKTLIVLAGVTAGVLALIPLPKGGPGRTGKPAL
ncbi:hypothetical protein A2Z33_02870 [Candidatus Gottesmanbacteria bacterium RBG_16_52_11]|uniref:DUF2029 domain-containing protein n=1 Tax=Candidatus Gottesmanbacteria bacterium RBG_16_52_11 TaxID=1798374 RepID=A0A1F5YN28_9BACT|nr:MAG: hypothetical protein A2Z33_02870 [Candidatus Gottesmanbacteria bacterium RBG_16_52_11]